MILTLQQSEEFEEIEKNYEVTETQIKLIKRAIKTCKTHPIGFTDKWPVGNELWWPEWDERYNW